MHNVPLKATEPQPDWKDTTHASPREVEQAPTPQPRPSSSRQKRRTPSIPSENGI